MEARENLSITWGTEKRVWESPMYLAYEKRNCDITYLQHTYTWMNNTLFSNVVFKFTKEL